MMKNITFSINFLNIFLIEILFFKCGRSRERVGIKIFVLFYYYITYFTFSAIKVKVVDNNWFT